MSKVNLLMDPNWFIKQEGRIDLGYEGESPLYIEINSCMPFDSCANYYLDISGETVPLTICKECSCKLVASVPGWIFPKAGSKALQLRVCSKEFTKMSNIVYGYVQPSVNGIPYPSGLPSEFHVFENRLDEKIKDVKANRVDPRSTFKAVVGAPYLFQAEYSDRLDFEDIYRYTRNEFGPVEGGCTGVHWGKYHLRSFDFYFNNMATVLLHKKANEDQAEYIGMASYYKELTREDILSGEDLEVYKYLPALMKDGINSYGVSIQMNVNSTDKGINKGTNPCAKLSVCASNFVSYFLCYAKKASDVYDIVQKINIEDMGTNYLNNSCHFFICDINSTFLLEFHDSKAVIRDISNNPITTNFYQADMKMVKDTDGQETRNIDRHSVDLHGMGIERFECVKESITSDNPTEQDAKELLQKLSYSNTYIPEDDRTYKFTNNVRWNTEMNGVYETSTGTYDINMFTNPETLDESFSEAYTLYLGEHDQTSPNYRGGVTWFSMYQCIYNLESRSVRVFSEENYDVDVVKFIDFQLGENAQPVNREITREEFDALVARVEALETP